MAGENKRSIIKRPLFRDEIKSALIEAIVSGELLPGDRIVETRLAKQYGVSQSPIREAIRELEMVGMVETIPYRGSFVRKLEKKDMIDIYKTRCILESAAVKVAIHNITESQLMEMDQCIKNMEKAMNNNDMQTFVENDMRFHEIFIDAGDNSFLHKIWNQCHIRDNTWLGAKYAANSLAVISDHHLLIKEAIEAGDEEKAVETVMEHFKLVIDIM